MKTLKRVLFFIAGIGLLLACSKSDRFWGDEPLGNTIKGGQGQAIMVTTPFKVDFIGKYMPTTGVDEEMCGEFPMIRVFNEGGGTATHPGRFTHSLDRNHYTG